MFILIQARFNSKRLPGKVLKKCAGKPILKWTIERLKRTKYDVNIAVITSFNKSDDPIAKFCTSENIKYFRGPLNDVAQRFIEAADFFKCKKFMRISADSPLIDPKLVDKAILLSRKNNHDLITNIKTRSFPKGQSIEIISLNALKTLVGEKLSSEEREHVTLGFYNRKKSFQILNFPYKNNNYSKVQLSIDTPEDFSKIESILKNHEDAIKLGWQELAKIKSKEEFVNNISTH